MTMDLAELFGVAAPIVLGPFGGLSSVELTAGVSEQGGLGSYGLYGYDATRIAETVDAIRERTGKPFALNLWVAHDEVQPGEVTPQQFAAYVAALEPFFREVGMEPPAQPERYLPSFDEQLEAVLDARPAVVSFVFGMPAPAFVDEARARGIMVVATATTVEEARALQAGGADAVVATGAEAAGHRVSFLRRAEDSLVGTFPLVPQVVDAVSVPVIAAGGIADRRGVRAAFALGAAGVQVGTAFLVTRQSAINDAHRRAIQEAPAHGTVLTRAMSGRLARGIPNRVVRSIEQSGVIAPFPVQNWLTGRFRAEATKQGLADLQSLWTGQAGPLARSTELTEVYAELRSGLPTETGER
ncbi:NAD(P)H-dependent flavin oxidoreductase [Leifsonia sp. NPDC058248]|uniref:NAD(P)H-dependent flavin oxidoreductase n=1 Tax=Leifsonia sp. NPDC058248 TaxID=3346402 RepID=UPI0036D93C89